MQEKGVLFCVFLHASVDALAMTHFEFEKNRIYPNKVYRDRDLCELDALGALYFSLNQLDNYLADHSNLSTQLPYALSAIKELS